MGPSDCDITNFAWLDHESVGSPSTHLYSLQRFRDRVVGPSLQALDEEISELHSRTDPEAEWLVEDIAALFHTTVEGYLIAVQSMWERGLRAMLIRREKKLAKPARPLVLERATWGGNHSLQGHFVRLMGVPMTAFDSFADLDFLQHLGSAIRHGDGAAARKIYELSPRLWFNWLPPGTEIVAGSRRFVMRLDGPPHPSFNTITLPDALLRQLIQSVIWFWEDIEHMRCNSFKKPDNRVLAETAIWRNNLTLRSGSRTWNPPDGAFPEE